MKKLILILLLLPTMAFGVTDSNFVLTGTSYTADSYMSEQYNSTNYANVGMKIGRGVNSSRDYYAIIDFPTLADSAAVTGRTIDSAFLTIVCQNYESGWDSNDSIDVYALVHYFVEVDVTWDIYDDNEGSPLSWNTGGAEGASTDIHDTLIDQQNWPEAVDEEITFNISSAVEYGWYDGFVLRWNLKDATRECTFGNSEHLTSSYHPYLTVYHTDEEDSSFGYVCELGTVAYGSADTMISLSRYSTPDIGASSISFISIRFKGNYDTDATSVVKGLIYKDQDDDGDYTDDLDLVDTTAIYNSLPAASDTFSIDFEINGSVANNYEHLLVGALFYHLGSGNPPDLHSHDAHDSSYARVTNDVNLDDPLSGLTEFSTSPGPCATVFYSATFATAGQVIIIGSIDCESNDEIFFVGRADRKSDLVFFDAGG